ncbi:MAG: hypothetical protein HUN05_00345 [Desulfobacter sp.]|nr:MAG: hypothetical protein HUN05_00345 [Desulfobacter sp.]
MDDCIQEMTPRMMPDLKKRSFVGIFIYTIALGVVVFSDGYFFRHPGFSSLFFFSITGICLLRFVYVLMEPWLRTWMGKTNQALFFAGVGFTALIWGVGFAKVMTQLQEMHIQMLMVVCTIGICAGGCMSFSPNLWAAIFFKVHPINAYLLL